MEPSHYIIVKGTTYIMGTEWDEVELSMALENGIIVLVTKTFPTSNIFINGNHMDEELILSHQGKLEEGLYQMSEDVETVFQSATQSFDPNDLFGGIIYIHANIPEGFYNYRRALVIALYLSSLLINDSLQKYTITELISKISSTGLVDQLFLEKQFYDYGNREFSLMVGSNAFKIPLDQDKKLIFCRLDLAPSDLSFTESQLKAYNKKKEKMLANLQSCLGIKSFYQAFESQIKIPSEILSKSIDSSLECPEEMLPESCENILPRELPVDFRIIEIEMKLLEILCSFSNKSVTFEKFLNHKMEIEISKGVISEETMELVESLKERTKVSSCALVEGQFVLMVVERSRFADVVGILRQMVCKGELKSKSCLKLEEELVETRWGADEEIGEKIFVSVPSKGIGVFDPQGAIWFD